jgi:pimeloyl-ACP methyl ester carboxylesterase
MKRTIFLTPFGLLLLRFILSLLCLSWLFPSLALAQKYADLPGIRLWYVDTGGDGIPVVFLHSNTGSSANWEHQVPAFTSAGYRFIAYDRRGWGKSITQPGAPVGTGADDLHGLMKYLKIGRFHLIATAGGGFVAMDYALSFSEELRSLVIANSIGAAGGRAILSRRESGRNAPMDRARTYEQTGWRAGARLPESDDLFPA